MGERDVADVTAVCGEFVGDCEAVSGGLAEELFDVLEGEVGRYLGVVGFIMGASEFELCFEFFDFGFFRDISRGLNF